MKRVMTAIAALWLAGCEAPGACEEYRVVSSEKTGFCFEVDSPAQCPIYEAGDESGEFKWEYFEGKRCDQIEKGLYAFDCGGGLFQDLETECAEATAN